MASELTIQLFRSYSRMVIRVGGEVDLSSAPQLSHALARANRMAEELLVDLERVEFMDCAGLRVLLEWGGENRERGPSRLAVTPGSPQVRRLFELTGASRLLTVISPASLEVRPAA